MNLVILVNKEFEEEKALFDLNKEQVLLSGDYYHDKIDAKIEGYLEALSDHNIYNKEVEEMYVDIHHRYFKLVRFYSE